MPSATVISSVKEKIKQLLSSKYAAIIIVSLAIIARALQLIYFFNTRSDMTYQVLGAQHFLSGHGISLATINTADISQVNYQRLN